MIENRLEKYTIKTDRCWIWSGGINPDGYARINIDKKYYYVHKLTYLMSKGYNLSNACKEYKNLKKIYSACGDRCCVNPEHFRTEKLEPTSLKNICRICKKELEEKSNFSILTPKPQV